MPLFKDYMTVTEAAEILDVSYMTVTNYIHRGWLKAHKVGGRWRIDEDDFKEFIKGTPGASDQSSGTP